MDFKNKMLNLISTIMAIALIILIIFSNQKSSIYVAADEVSSGSGLVNLISKDTSLAYIEEFSSAQRVENDQTELVNEEENEEDLQQVTDSYNEDSTNSEKTNVNATSENRQSKEKNETEDKSEDEQEKIEKDADSSSNDDREEEKKRKEKIQEEEREEKEAENNDPVITTKVVNETETIEYETVREEDASLPKGETKVRQEGENGSRTVTYLETYTDGELTNREQTKSKIKTEPVKKIIKVGTKEELE